MSTLTRMSTSPSTMFTSRTSPGMRQDHKTSRLSPLSVRSSRSTGGKCMLICTLIIRSRKLAGITQRHPWSAILPGASLLRTLIVLLLHTAFVFRRRRYKHITYHVDCRRSDQYDTSTACKQPVHLRRPKITRNRSAMAPMLCYSVQYCATVCLVPAILYHPEGRSQWFNSSILTI